MRPPAVSNSSCKRWLSPPITTSLAWAIITGIFEIAAAIEFRKVVSSEWAMILSGIISILLGVFLFTFPAAGAVGIVWLIGMYAIAFGIMGLIFAFHLRGLLRSIEKVGVTA
jgi:uncharacterized membrane protein HdeD (DUF308 family)